MGENEIRPVPKPVKKLKKKKKTRKVKTSRAKLVEEIDHLDSDYCLIVNDFTCMLCGKTANQTHHFFHKGSHGNVRFDRRNHCPVCLPCHRRRIHDAGETEELRDKIIEKIGISEFDKLKTEAYKISDYSESTLRDILSLKMHDLVFISVKYHQRTNFLSDTALKRLEKARKFVDKCKSDG